MTRKKYDKLYIYSVSGEESVIMAAREKAKADGKSLSEVIDDFLNAYTMPNTTTFELERQVNEQQQVVNSENIKLEALKARLKQKTGEIPSEFIEYYNKKRKAWTEEQRQGYIQQTAEKLKCDLEWLREKLEGPAKPRPGEKGKGVGLNES